MNFPKLQNKQEHSDLLTRIAANESGATRECIKKYSAFIYSLAKKYTFNQADAEYAVQDVFLDIWQCASRYDYRQSSEIGFIALIANAV